MSRKKFAAVMLIALISLAVYLKSVSNYKQAVSNITFQNLDVSIGTIVGKRQKR